jgi:hypothetical protein
LENKFYYISFSEYDLGEHGIIFRSENQAREFMKDALEWSGSTESVDTYLEDGFAVIEEVTIYGE